MLYFASEVTNKVRKVFVACIVFIVNCVNMLMNGTAISTFYDLTTEKERENKNISFVRHIVDFGLQNVKRVKKKNKPEIAAMTANELLSYFEVFFI